MWKRHKRKILPANMDSPSPKPDAMKSVKRNSIVDKFFVSKDPVPQVPESGAKIRVCFAGACYAESELTKSGYQLPRIAGIHDTTLFAGFEVSGIVDELGSMVDMPKVKPGDRVVVFPRKELSNVGFAQFITVEDVNDLIRIPDSLPLEVAAILPSGALRSFSAVLRAKPFIESKMHNNSNSVTNILIVGAGAMGLWTLKLAHHYLVGDKGKVRITVADTNVNKLMIAKDQGCYDVIHWNDAIHEEHIIARTRDAISGGVDIAIDFVSSLRTIDRVMKVLKEEGVLIVGGNSKHKVTIDLSELSLKKQSILGVDSGTVEQLETLVHLVGSGMVKPPIYTVYPVEEANKVFELLNESKINGRAILQVQLPQSGRR